MLDIVMNIGEILSPIFYKILYMSVVGSAIGIIVFTLMKIFENKLSAKAKCYLWIIPIVFLLLPINRIEINTKRDIPAAEVVDRFETAISNISERQFTERLENTQTEENITKEKEYTKRQIVSKLIPLVWVSVSALGVIAFILGNIKLNIKVNMNKRCRDTKVKEILNKCRERLRINKRIGIKFQNFNGSPCIYGIIHPKILIPNTFQEKSEEILENVFMHELSHYKRKDMVTNYVLLMITTIHWFNPFVYYLFRKIRQDMELATDEIALKQMNKEQKKRYGMTLISLLETYENKSASVEMLCITDNNKNMERRIKKIKLETKLKKYKKSIVVLVIALVICALIPFVLKTSSIASSNEEEYINERIDSEKINSKKMDLDNESKNIVDYINYDIKNVSYDMYKNKNLVGEWKPYKVESTTGEINLADVYGSGIKMYGGNLDLRDDGTYTKFIGIYPKEQEANLVGTYDIVEPKDDQEGRHFLIVLYPKSGETQNLTYLENDGIIIEKIDLETEVYYTK